MQGARERVLPLLALIQVWDMAMSVLRPQAVGICNQPLPLFINRLVRRVRCQYLLRSWGLYLLCLERQV